MNKILHSSSAALIGAFLCILLNPTVVGFYSFTIFFNSLSAELGWGHGVLGLAITIGTLTIAVVAPFLGGVADRGGARKLVVSSAVLLAALLGAMPWLCKSLIGLYLSFALIGVLAAGYYVSLPRIISSWFDGRRGLALGFVMSGTGLGSAVLSPVLARTIAQSGWTTGYFLLAIAVLVVAVPSALFLVHERKMPPAALSEVQIAKPKIGAELILFAVAFFFMGLGLHGVLINFSPILTSRGLSPAEAAGVFALAGIAMFLGRIGCGFLLDLFPANRIGAVLMLGAAGGVAALSYADSRSAFIVAACLFGLGVSAELDLLSYIISRRYPIAHFSRLFAFVYAAFMVGTSFGPPLVGGLYDKFGNYFVGTWGSAALVAVSAVALACMPKTPTRASVKSDASFGAAAAQ